MANLCLRMKRSTFRGGGPRGVGCCLRFRAGGAGGGLCGDDGSFPCVAGERFSGFTWIPFSSCSSRRVSRRQGNPPVLGRGAEASPSWGGHPLSTLFSWVTWTCTQRAFLTSTPSSSGQGRIPSPLQQLPNPTLLHPLLQAAGNVLSRVQALLAVDARKWKSARFCGFNV